MSGWPKDEDKPVKEKEKTVAENTQKNPEQEKPKNMLYIVLLLILVQLALIATAPFSYLPIVQIPFHALLAVLSLTRESLMELVTFRLILQLALVTAISIILLNEYSSLVIVSLGLLRPSKIRSMRSGLYFMSETEKLGQTLLHRSQNQDSDKFAEF